MLHVYFTNHGYFSQETFQDFDAAVVYVRKTGFEASICLPYRKDQPYKGCEVLAHWTMFGGLHDRRQVA